jgi:oligopeptide/dipeptide ABC transporter ATP-binding protein
LNPLIEARNLTKHYDVLAHQFSRRKSTLRAVDDVSFTIDEGEILAMVGESGCGKTTTAKLLLRLMEPTSGSVRFQDEEIYSLDKSRVRTLRRQMQLIYQNPSASLNPRKTVRQTLSQPFAIHKEASGSELDARLVGLLEEVELKPAETFLDRHTDELSGGQKQRVAIARAIALRPKFVVADEPVSALDPSVRAYVLNLLMKLRSELRLTYFLITHDMSVVWTLGERVAVMYVGQIVEIGRVEDVLKSPAHPYTIALLSAAPLPDPEASHLKERFIPKGELPSPINPPSGCRFRTRCPLAITRCAELIPSTDLGNGHFASCIFAEEIVAGRKSLPKS